MVYNVPTEASNGPTYIYIAYLLLTITDLTYICDNFGLTTDGSNKMSRSANLNQARRWIFRRKTTGLVFFKLHNKDY